MKYSILLVMGLLVGGCAAPGSNVRTFIVADKTDRSIVVPPQGTALEEPIKDKLRVMGWRVFATDPGTVVGQIQIHYGMRVQVQATNEAGWFWYQVNMFDRRSGKEVIEMDGKDDEKTIISNLEKYLDPLFEVPLDSSLPPLPQ